MRVNIRIFGEISRVIGSKHTIEIEENSIISSVIRQIQKHAGLNRSKYLGRWRVGSADLAIIVNGKNVNLLQGMNTRVHENDDIVITPYATGG